MDCVLSDSVKMSHEPRAKLETTIRDEQIFVMTYF
jgi:hypothetical protein